MKPSHKKKIHVYTDCPYFGGCENMISVLSYSKDCNEKFNLVIHYRYSKKYEAGFKKKANHKCESIGVKKIYSGDLVKAIKNNSIRRVCYLFEGTLFKYPITIWNVIILMWHFINRSIDLLHVNNGGYPAARSCNAAVIAAKLIGIKKIVYVVNNKTESYRNPMRWLDWPIDMLVKRFCDRFITGSKFSSLVLKKVLKLSDDKATVINNAVKIPSNYYSNDNLREQLKIKFQKVCVGIVAVHEDRKGHIYCLKAYQEILSKGLIPPTLLIEGFGSKTELLKSYVKENNLSQYVVFVGQVESIYEFYHCIDLLVLPSVDCEDFPNVIIEAMGVGLPVVGTNVAGIPEQIVDGENGYVVEARDCVGLSEAIMKIALDESLRKKMACKSKELYQRNYTPEVAIKKYINLYYNT